MLPCLVWLCLVAAAGPVVHREGLGGPRKLLRYRGRLQETQALRLEMWQELRREQEESGASQSQKSPCVALELEITPEAFEGGVTSFRIRVANAEASGGTVSGDQVGRMRRAVSALKRLKGRGAVAEDGSRADLQWEGPERLPPDTEALAAQARDVLVAAFAPQPPTLLGEDAQWSVRSTGESTPGEPAIAETVFTCSVIGDGAVITGVASAEAVEAVKVAGQRGPVRDRVAVDVRSRARLRPGRLFPELAATRTLTAHYSTGFLDRQSWEVRLVGEAERAPRAVAVLAAGEEPRVAIEYPATVRPRRYAIEYLENETEARDGRVAKRGRPRVRVVVRVKEWPQSEPRFSDGCVMEWTVEEATVEGLAGRGGGGAYGRACDAIVGYVRDEQFEGKLVTKRGRMEPDVWLELPDDAPPEVVSEAARLCEVVERSMLLMPEKRYAAPDEEDGDVSVTVPRMGKGGAWRHVDELLVPGLAPLKRVVECKVAEVTEESFTVTCDSLEALCALGPAPLNGGKADLKACTARRTGSWTIARDHPMPARANVEEVLDREYEVVGKDGTARTVRIHGVRSVTIKALE
jgi:hypothetical protein